MKAKVKRNNKYVFRVVLAVWIMMAVVLTAFMPDTVRAEASETEKAYAAVYDYDYYKSHNADLQKAFGNERQSYVDHFVRCGMKEGRQGNEEFNLEVYKYNWADLRAAYKDDNVAYYKHYIKYGKAEGRNAKTKEQQKASTVYEGMDYAAVYNYEYYRKNNADLQKIFGEDSAKYLKHFVQYGMKEGRQGSEEFNLEVYKYNGADLCAAYKDNNAAYYKHYINYGKAEGRNAKTKEQQKASTVYEGTDYATVYNYEYYRKNNADLQKIFGEDSAKYLKHFVQYGMKEGRQGSEEFNLEVYKYNSADLCAAYKDNNAAYYKHYINYGKAEGRNAKTKEQQKASTIYEGTDYAAVYNYEYYRKNNVDLQKIFGEDSAKYLKHFVQYGMNEGRQGNDEFILYIYKINYSDLEAAFKSNNAAYYKHYIKYGKAEGRNAKTLIAPVEGDYIITVDANGGYLSGDTSRKMAVCSGKIDYSLQTLLKDVLVDNMAENSDKHLMFDGWYYDKALTEPVGVLAYKYPNKDVTIYAKWADCYTITFDANGGNLGHSAETVRQYKSKKGESFFTLISAWNDDPHKIFAGWYLDKEKTQPFELDYYGNFVPQSDMTIYAGWKESVAVSFDMNGGYYYNANLDKETDLYVSKTEAGATLSDIPFPRNNDVVKEFEGWYWDKECKKAVENMNTVKFDKDVTVYAKWKVVYLKLTADACGGYFICDGNEIKEKREIGIEQGSGPWQLLSYRPMNADKHKVFDEWYLDKEYTQRWDMSYEFTKDTTVYAKWNDVFVVTFDANGGYFYDPNEKPILTMQMSIEPNKMPYCTQTPQIEDSHKTFDGWYLDKECTVKASEYLVNSDVTLYAKWLDCYNITFDANGGAFSLREPIARKKFVKVISGNEIGNVEEPFDCDQINREYVFDGWTLDAAGTMPVENVVQYIPTKDMVFYAKWYKLIKVTFDANGGCFYNNERTTEITSLFSKNQSISASGQTPDALSENQAFAGWYFDKECTKPVDDVFVPTSDMRIYAKWDESVTLTINANGGSFADWVSGYTSIDNQNLAKKVAKGIAIKKVPIPYKPQDTDLQLWGWYLNPECTEKIEDITSYAPTQNVTIYAKWAPPPVITFDANGGYLVWEDGPATLSYPATLNEPVSDAYKMILGGAAKKGAVFAGWYFDKECTQKAENIPAYIVTGDVTFYAKWEVNEETQAQISEENVAANFAEILDSEAKVEVTTELETEATTETITEVEDESEEAVTESETEVIQELEDESENSALETAEILQPEMPEAETEVTIQESTAEEPTTEEPTIQESVPVENSN